MTESTMRGREMRTTETVLNVLSERGKNHKPVERLHRQLYNIGLHEMAYGQIYVNRGATTRGVNDNTLDGTSRKYGLKWAPKIEPLAKVYSGAKSASLIPIAG